MSKENPLDVISRFKEKYPAAVLITRDVVERNHLILALRRVIKDKLFLDEEPCDVASLWAYDYIYEPWQSILQRCNHYNDEWLRFVAYHTTNPEVLSFIATSSVLIPTRLDVVSNRHTSRFTLAAMAGHYMAFDIAIIYHPNVDIDTLRVISEFHGAYISRMVLPRIAELEGLAITSDWSPESFFEHLRAGQNHLGFGEIRMTLDMQTEFCRLIEKFYIKKTGNV